MEPASRRLAGILLIVYPTVVLGGTRLLRMLVSDPGYSESPLQQDFWRAGHAHAGVLLALSLILLRYVDETRLSNGWKAFARVSTPIAAILLPAAFFLSVLSAEATEPSAVVHLAWPGAAVLVAGFVTLGVGLVRR